LGKSYGKKTSALSVMWLAYRRQNDLALLAAAHEIMLLLPKQGMAAPAFNIHGTHDVIFLLISQVVIAVL
jgi:hypothetical protein